MCDRYVVQWFWSELTYRPRAYRARAQPSQSKGGSPVHAASALVHAVHWLLDGITTAAGGCDTVKTRAQKLHPLPSSMFLECILHAHAGACRCHAAMSSP